MLEGSYELRAQTPLGLKRGKITFERVHSESNQKQGALKVRLEIAGFRIVLSRAQISDEDFLLVGSIEHLLGSAPFKCEGSVQGGSLSAVASSGDVSIDIKGTRLV